jgi:hypothetical protein
VPVHFFPHRHADALGDAAGWQVLGANQGYQPGSFQISESPVAAGNSGLRSETLSPKVAAQVVPDFIKPLAFDLLHDNAAVTNSLVKFGPSRLFQFHRPESNPVILIALSVACNPLLDSGAIIASGVLAHGFGIAQDPGHIMSIVGSEFAEEKPRGLEDWHHLDYVADTLRQRSQ